jgi:glycosyltransferase involved in cell wall biosynthesis
LLRGPTHVVAVYEPGLQHRLAAETPGVSRAILIPSEGQRNIHPTSTAIAFRRQLSMDQSNYIVITPVRDEAPFVANTITALEAQTIAPRRWIVVDDGSTDGTGAILDQHADQIPWMSIVHLPNRGHRVNGGGVMDAFHAGLSLLRDDNWDYLVKLDGDLSFGPDYFERCFELFDADPTLGIAGGKVHSIIAGKLEVDSTHYPPFHVRGATKIYRRACWAVVSPLLRAPGWDTVDEIKANMLGWRTRTFQTLTLVQHKPTGSAEGLLRNAFKNGRANRNTGYDPLFMLAKCIMRLCSRPFLIGSLAMALGYWTKYGAGASQMPDRRLVDYVRQQQRRRLLLRPSIYSD